MPTVFVSQFAREFGIEQERLELEAGSVRQLLNLLDEQYPGIKNRICQDDELRPGLSVSINGRIAGMGLYQRLEPNDEVHFIPAIGGG